MASEVNERWYGRHDSIGNKAKDVEPENIKAFVRCLFIFGTGLASSPVGFE